MKTFSTITYHGTVSEEPEIIEENVIELNQVGIYLKPSDLLIWSMWMCFNKNITYLCLDSNVPLYRLSNMITETGIDTCITSSKYKDKIPGIEKYILIDNYDDLKKLAIYHGSSENAYVIFTSGTTGQPKGIQISRESVLLFIEAFSKTIGLQEKEKILCSTSCAFDIFFVESILALYQDMDIVVADEIEKNTPREICRLLQEENIDVLQITPSRMQGIITYDESLKSFDKLKTIMVGGERFPYNLLKKLQERTSAQIYNLYGPAETTIWATCTNLTKEKEVHIGHVLPFYKIYIVDNELKMIVGDGEGQIAIGGPCIAKGYLNRPNLSMEKFVELKNTGEQVYLTGDIAKRGRGDKIYFLGRKDLQVKIRGNRVEIEEVENVLQSIEGVGQVLVSKEDTEYGEKLIAFCHEQNKLNYEFLKEELKKQLPNYMIPQEFIDVKEFPITTNGKVSREKLLEDYHKRKLALNEIQLVYTNVIEKEVIEVILDNVERENISMISRESRLVDLGINSLLYINLIAVLEEKYNITFDNEMLIIGEIAYVGQIVDYILENRVNQDK